MVMFNTLIVLQLEVGGSVTTKQLDNLISQTEYGLAVTPIYDEGPGQPMLGNAITGENHHYCYITDNGNVPSFACFSLK